MVEKGDWKEILGGSLLHNCKQIRITSLHVEFVLCRIFLHDNPFKT